MKWLLLFGVVVMWRFGGLLVCWFVVCYLVVRCVVCGFVCIDDLVLCVVFICWYVEW